MPSSKPSAKRLSAVAAGGEMASGWAAQLTALGTASEKGEIMASKLSPLDATMR